MRPRRSFCLLLLLLIAARPAEREDTADKAKQALSLLADQKWAEAELALVDVIASRPGDCLVTYGLACAQARQDKQTVAMANLERAILLGFSDFNEIRLNPDLDALRELARFKNLLAKKDYWQRRAANAMLTALKARFGKNGSYRYVIDHEHKLVIAAAQDEEGLEKTLSWLRRQAISQQRELFSGRPDAYVSVIIPSPQDFKKIIRVPTVGGLYNDSTKVLISGRTGPALVHEFTHALHAADRAPLRQEHAPWLMEGLGAMFEDAEFNEDDELVPAINSRIRAARGLAARGTYIPFARLMSMANDEFMQRPLVTYPQSASILLYLRHEGKLREFYDAYKENFRKDPTGLAVFEQVCGKPIDEIERDWAKWLKTVQTKALR